MSNATNRNEERSEAYIEAQGSTCPNPACGATLLYANVEIQLSFDNDEGTAVVGHLGCEHCGAYWTIEYPIAGIREVRDTIGQLIEPEAEPEWVLEAEKEQALQDETQ